MDVVTGWTGRTACALQTALRMSNVDFARHLDIGLRTVADWHDDPNLKPRPEKQGLLDSALAMASPEERKRFAVLTGQSRPAASAISHETGPAADAERRLAADENISGALGRLDRLAGWQPGTARRRVAERLTGLDRRELLDRASRRKRIGRRAVADALGGYYRGQAGGHGRYAARCGQDGSEVVTTVLTCPDWLDLSCVLTADHDRLRLAGPAAEGNPLLDAGAADAAVQRLAETLVAGTRFADMPTARIVRDLDELRAFRSQPGGAVYVVGGASLVRSLIDAGLIDELRLILHPVALGTGAGLFEGIAQRRDLELVDSGRTSTGRVHLTYRVPAPGTSHAR